MLLFDDKKSAAVLATHIWKTHSGQKLGI